MMKYMKAWRGMKLSVKKSSKSSVRLIKALEASDKSNWWVSVEIRPMLILGTTFRDDTPNEICFLKKDSISDKGGENSRKFFSEENSASVIPET